MPLAKRIKILELRDIRLAKVDYKGSFQGIGKAYQKLTKWSRSNGLNDPQKNKTITIYHDDPNEVGMNNVRQSACIINDKQIEPQGEIKTLEFSPGKCVVGRYEISFFQFREAWVEIYSWLENNNLQKAGDAFEVYQNHSNQHPQKKTTIDICIPIK